MKKKRIFSKLTLAVSTFALALVALPASAAPPVLTISVSGYGSVSVDTTGLQTYTGACSAATCPGMPVVGNGSNGLQVGQISWNGSVQNFSGSMIGTSAHVAALPQLDLDMSGMTTTGAATVTISWTDINFTQGGTPATMNVSGAGPGGTYSFTSYTDNTNAPFGTGTPVNNLTGMGTATGPGPTSATFSMTDIAVLTLPAGIGTDFPPASFDFLFNDAPTPLSVDCASLSSGTVGLPYSGNVNAIGGIAPYTYTVSAGSLTPLLLNNTTGAITGTPTVAGTLNFTAQVVDSSGNAASNTASSACTIIDTTPHTTTPPPVGKDDTATIGFWHNKNGQGVILALNGGPKSTALGNWLASNFPYLYGAQSSHNMAGKPNTTVAALFMSFFSVSGQKTQAQILAGALASYVTDSNLTGLPGGVGFGFNSEPGGTGAHTINVGSYGTAIGLLNNTSYTVTQLLNQVNADIQNGVYNTAAQNAFNVIFSNINQTGDIS